MRPSAARAVLLGGAAYFIVLAVYAAFIGTWTDEEYTLATTAHGVGHAWRRAIDYELQAPLYFVVLAVWRELSPSVWFARLFSILCATGFYFALHPILRRTAPGLPTVWAALLIACNPFVIYTALDIRLYAPALFLSALGWLAFDAGFASGESTVARRWFVVVAVVALYTQYFLGFALVGYAATLAVTGRVRGFRPYAWALVFTAAASLPLLSIVRSQIGGSGETAAAPLALLRQTLFHPALDFALPYDPAWNAFGLRAPYFALTFGLLALAAAARPAKAKTLAGALAGAAAIDVLFVAVVLAFRLALNERHYVVLFLPAMVAGYALIAALEAGTRPLAGTCLRAVYATLTLVALFANYHAVAQAGDTLRVGAYLERHAGPGAVVAVFPADALPAYARAYRGPAHLVPFPEQLAKRTYDLSAITVRDENEALAALARLPRARRTWFVMLGACPPGDVSYGCDAVLAGLRDGSRIASERHFHEARVFAITVRAPSARSASAARAARRSAARPAP